MMDTDLAISLIEQYYDETFKDKHGRYMSWIHCFSLFSKSRGTDIKDNDYIDYMALNLAFYLASWGMYRGSSFLLQRDYKFHTEVVKILLEPKYDVLLSISPKQLIGNEALDLVDDLKGRIYNYYITQTPAREDKKNITTDTLLTKILLGTLGCVPAYDNYYINAVKEFKVSSGVFNRKSVRSISEFYIDRWDIFEKTRAGMCRNGVIYPPMKLMDMCFWQYWNLKEKKEI